MRELLPELADSFWANHAFTRRAAALIAERGIRQFLDIGAGLPRDFNVRDIVRERRPDAVVAYVDHDPEVVEHGQRFLHGVSDAVFRAGDLLDSNLLREPAIRRLLDLKEPVGVLIVGVLDFIADEEDPWKAVRQVMERLPDGSYLALTHVTDDMMSEARAGQAHRALSATSREPHFRNREEVTRFFDSWELESAHPGARPGVNYIGLWGAEDPTEADDDPGRWWYAGIARKTSRE